VKLASFLCGLALLAAISVCADGIVEDCTEQDLRVALEGGGEVLFADDCSITISNTIIIDEPDVIIDGGEFSITFRGTTNRLFEVRPGATLTLLNVSLTDGQSTNGAAVYVHSTGSLLASNCVFTGNEAIGFEGSDGAGGRDSDGTGSDGRPGRSGTSGLGGAVFNAGEFLAQRCQFFTNTASGGRGGNGGNGGNGRYRGGNGGSGGNGGAAIGGAIYSRGTLEVTDCTFSGNLCTAADGGIGGEGGIGPFPGYPSSGGAGGEALGAAVYSTGGNITVLNSTFEANSAFGGDSQAGGTGANRYGKDGERGGRAMGAAIFSAGLLSVTNSTFTENRVTGGAGGDGGPGIYYAGDGGDGGPAAGAGITGPGTKMVVNCTLVENRVFGGTNGLAGNAPFPRQNGKRGATRGGNIANLDGTFRLINTIVGTNSAGAAAYGNFIDGGNNICADDSMNLGPTSRVRTDPRLGPYSNNGGPTRTFPLLTNSPAIDRGNTSAAPDVDQRGISRPIGAQADIGAYEFSHTLSGRVLLGSTGLEDVLVEAADASVSTDSTGSFLLSAGDGPMTLTPSLAGYRFTPASLSLSVTGNVTGITFAATRLMTLNGRILEGTNGVSGVSVLVGTNTVTTSTNGTFAISLPIGSYLVTPSLACYRFAPTNQTVNLSSSTNRADFTASRIHLRLSGRVRLGAGGLAGVQVSAGGMSSVTDTNGSYTITNLCPGIAYNVVPSLQGYTFTPNQAPILLAQDTSNVDFTASTGFTIIAPAGTPPELTFPGSNGVTYWIEASTDLRSWESVYTNTAPIRFQDVSATNHSSRFYRLRP
jgi:hypothetical protein